MAKNPEFESKIKRNPRTGEFERKNGARPMKLRARNTSDPFLDEAPATDAETDHEAHNMGGFHIPVPDNPAEEAQAERINSAMPEIYGYLYDHPDDFDTGKLNDEFAELSRSNVDLVRRVVNLRQDFLSSDRECAAFVIAYHIDRQWGRH